MSRRRRKKRRQREMEALQGELLGEHGGAAATAEAAAQGSPFPPPVAAPAPRAPVAAAVVPGERSATPKPDVAAPEAPGLAAAPEPEAAGQELPTALATPKPDVATPEAPAVAAAPEPVAPKTPAHTAAPMVEAPEPPAAAAPPIPDAAASHEAPDPGLPGQEHADGLGSIPPAPSPDRWARALGHRSPSRSSPRGHAPTPAETERTNGEAAVRAPAGPELHESARDHAAARVRPAGEPLARAKELVQRGRIDEAIDLYLGILTVNPANLKAHNNLGVLFDELRQYEDALEHFEAAERIAPENVEVLTNYASTLTSLARYDEAEALLRRAQKLDADGINVRLAIGILYFRRGLYAQAEAELRPVCARDNDIGPAFYYRGEALNRLGRFEEALPAMERAKVLMPNDPRPFYTLGHLYDRQFQPEEAAEMYRHARRLQKR